MLLECSIVIEPKKNLQPNTLTKFLGQLTNPIKLTTTFNCHLYPAPEKGLVKAFNYLPDHDLSVSPLQLVVYPSRRTLTNC